MVMRTALMRSEISPSRCAAAAAALAAIGPSNAVP